MTADQQLAEGDIAQRAEHLTRGAAVAAQRRAAERLRARVTDFGTDPAARLDDRMRALLLHHLEGIVNGIEAQLREEAARLLMARGDRADAAHLRAAAPAAMTMLFDAGVFRDHALLGELLGQLRQDIMAERLPPRVGDADEPSLLARLAEVADTDVARAARALLVAESRRREALALGAISISELPAELHQRLVWLVAASLRDPRREALDRGLVESVGRVLAAHDEGERADACAMRLALAIDARPQEVASLIDEAVNDRRLSLALAVLAHAAQLSFEQVRDLAVEPDDERWWLLLRAVDLDPLSIASIGLAFAEADPRRRDDDLPALLDAVNAVPAEDARAALSVLRLPADFRAALAAVSPGSLA